MAEDAGRPEDQQAVGEVLMRLARAFGELDPSGIESLYSADADWTNAYGTSRKGGAEIAAYLTGLFADSHFAAGRPLGPPQASMRFPVPDIAIVKTFLERAGQQTTEGVVMPVRLNDSLKVLQRQADGWRIISDIYMDARDDSTYEAG